MRALILLPLLAGCTLTDPLAGQGPGPAPAPLLPPAGAVTYACDVGKSLVVTYGVENGLDMIMIDIDGPEMLLAEPAAQGLRYAWPSDGSHHIWVLDAAGTGTLSYRDGEQGTTTPLRTGCRA